MIPKVSGKDIAMTKATGAATVHENQNNETTPGADVSNRDEDATTTPKGEESADGLVPQGTRAPGGQEKGTGPNVSSQAQAGPPFCRPRNPVCIQVQLLKDALRLMQVKLDDFLEHFAEGMLLGNHDLSGTRYNQIHVNRYALIDRWTEVILAEKRNFLLLLAERRGLIRGRPRISVEQFVARMEMIRQALAQTRREMIGAKAMNEAYFRSLERAD